MLNVVWAPLMMLLPHDHSMWASIAIYTGREDNVLWEADAIHSVTNPIQRLTGAIHVYGGDFFATEGRSEWDPETLRRRPFDLAAARATFREAQELFASGRSAPR